MMLLVEKYIRGIRSLRSDQEGKAVLQQIADDFRFRSGFLIEFNPDLKGAVRILDTSPDRAAQWAQLFQKVGVLPGMSGIKSMRDDNLMARPRPANFDSDHPYLPFARQYDLLEFVSVPISQGENVMGIVGFSGDVPSGSNEELALKVLGYSLFSQLRAVSKASGQDAPQIPHLTPREREVMQLSAEGLTSAAIAVRLGMAARTVNQHVDNVGDKLGTRNRVHTIAELVRRDLLS